MIETSHDSASSRCACGGTLPTSDRGRRRQSCSPACKRRRDQTIRKVQARRAWIALWLISQAEPDQVAAAVAELEDEIRQLPRSGRQTARWTEGKD